MRLEMGDNRAPMTKHNFKLQMHAAIFSCLQKLLLRTIPGGIPSMKTVQNLLLYRKLLRDLS